MFWKPPVGLEQRNQGVCVRQKKQHGRSWAVTGALAFPHGESSRLKAWKSTLNPCPGKTLAVNGGRAPGEERGQGGQRGPGVLPRVQELMVDWASFAGIRTSGAEFPLDVGPSRLERR